MEESSFIKDKKTHFFPIDWAGTKLVNECDLITKGTTPTSLGRDFTNEGVNFIKIESLTEDGNIVSNKVAYIDLQTHNLLNRSQLKENDILISIAGALGRVAIVGKEILPANINQALSIVRLKRNSKVHLKYLFFYLNGPIIKKHIELINVQAAQANLSLADINNFKVNFPPLPEQKAIAQVLSTADAAIHTTEKLIAQKELRKKWLMQQLLTGKKRLKGFTGEWKEKKLGKVVEICSSKRVLEEDWKTNGIPFYRTREIIKLSNEEELKSPIFITEELYEELKAKFDVPKPNDILVTGVGTIGETYVVQENDKFYFKDGNVIWFKMNDNINSSFLSQLFKTTFIRKQLMDNASITTVATFTIDGAKNTKIIIPTIEEQNAIAKVLQSADKEISLLKAKAEKLRELKKGLMQVLLTGKVRLKI